MKVTTSRLDQILGFTSLFNRTPAVTVRRADAVETLRTFLEERYQSAHPNLEPQRIAEWVGGALATARDNLPGAVGLVQAMCKLAVEIPPFCVALDPANYLEILYLGVTRCDFATNLCAVDEIKLLNEMETTKWAV